jgi:hypothetical protein
LLPAPPPRLISYSIREKKGVELSEYSNNSLSLCTDLPGHPKELKNNQTARKTDQRKTKDVSKKLITMRKFNFRLKQKRAPSPLLSIPKAPPSPSTNKHHGKPPLTPPKVKVEQTFFPPELEPASSYDTDTSTETDSRKTTQARSVKLNKIKVMQRNNRRDDAIASADKEMEERAKRAKELLSQRYRGLRNEQVRR